MTTTTTTTAEELWSGLQRELRERLDDEELATWFGPLRVVEQEDASVLRLVAPNESFVNAIEQSYRSAIEDSLKVGLQLEAVRVEVVVSAAPEGASRPARRRPSGELPAYQAVLDALAAMPGDIDYAELRLLLEKDLPPTLRDASSLQLEEVREQLVAALAGKVLSPNRWADRALGRGPAGDTGQSGLVGDDEPWPEKVEASVLLDALSTQFTRFAILPEGAAVALPLWVLFTHAIEAFWMSPRLAIISPEKRCGKSTLLGLLELLCRRSLVSASISAAAIFRAVEAWKVTLLIDEADTFLAQDDDLRGMLNAGHRRGAHAVRVDPETLQVRKYSSFCAVAVAMIGDLDGRLDTLGDRSIKLRMRRRLAGEPVEQLRLDGRSTEGFVQLRRMAQRWAEDSIEELAQRDPQVPRALNDRAADSWRPLLAIAEGAGGAWPARAREAAVLLSGSAEEAGVGELLLADIQLAFDQVSQDGALTSTALLHYLNDLEERPWAEWKNGRNMTPNQLAGELARFRIRPVKFRRGGRESQQLRGYRRESFYDAWGRYCAPKQLPLPLPVAPLPLDRCLTVSPPLDSTSCGEKSLSHANGRETAANPSNPLIPQAVRRWDSGLGGTPPGEGPDGLVEPHRAVWLHWLNNGWHEHPAFARAAPGAVDAAIAAIQAADTVAAIQAAVAALVEPPAAPGAAAAASQEAGR